MTGCITNAVMIHMTIRGLTFKMLHCTQGLIETLGSMVIFDEDLGVSDLSKYEFHCSLYVKI
jgi:hypothetical protein